MARCPEAFPRIKAGRMDPNRSRYATHGVQAVISPLHFLCLRGPIACIPPKATPLLVETPLRPARVARLPGPGLSISRRRLRPAFWFCLDLPVQRPPCAGFKRPLLDGPVQDSSGEGSIDQRAGIRPLSGAREKILSPIPPRSDTGNRGPDSRAASFDTACHPGTRSNSSEMAHTSYRPSHPVSRFPLQAGHRPRHSLAPRRVSMPARHTPIDHR
jgi:hypothetical protein